MTARRRRLPRPGLRGADNPVSSSVPRRDCRSGGVSLGPVALPELRHEAPAEVLFGLHEIMTFAEQPDVADRGFASERNLEIVVELEPVCRAADLSVSHRPGAAPFVALPNRALDRSGDVAVVFTGSFRLRALPVSQRLALSISLEDQFEGLAHDLFEVPVGALVRERDTHLLQLVDELRRDRDVETAQLRSERLDDLGRQRRLFGSRGNQIGRPEQSRQSGGGGWADRRGRTERTGRSERIAWHWPYPNEVSRHGLRPVLDGKTLGFLLRLSLSPGEHPGMVLFCQHLSKLDQGADRQPAFRQSIGDDGEPRDQASRFRSPEGRGLRKPELADAVIKQRSVAELSIELPLRKASQLDDELDCQMPLPPNQVGEAAVEVARGGRFHSNPLTRVFLPSCEGARRPWAHALAMPAFQRPDERARTAGRDARALVPLPSRWRSRRADPRARLSMEMITTATICRPFLAPYRAGPPKSHGLHFARIRV